MVNCFMAKAKSDVILRDRLQFTLTSDADLSLVYGRIDLSDYVNVVERKGLLIKDIFIQPRDPNNGSGEVANTGIWSVLFSDIQPAAGTDSQTCWKFFVSSRAYESAADVGIASPDVLHIEEYVISRYTGDPTVAMTEGFYRGNYPMRDFHPGGYPVVSDLLVGVAVDASDTDSEFDSATLEVDIMLIAEPTTITQKDMTQLLTQAQDL